MLFFSLQKTGTKGDKRFFFADLYERAKSKSACSEVRQKWTSKEKEIGYPQTDFHPNLEDEQG